MYFRIHTPKRTLGSPFCKRKKLISSVKTFKELSYPAATLYLARFPTPACQKMHERFILYLHITISVTTPKIKFQREVKLQYIDSNLIHQCNNTKTQNHKPIGLIALMKFQAAELVEPVDFTGFRGAKWNDIVASPNINQIIKYEIG